MAQLISDQALPFAMFLIAFSLTKNLRGSLFDEMLKDDNGMKIRQLWQCIAVGRSNTAPYVLVTPFACCPFAHCLIKIWRCVMGPQTAIAGTVCNEHISWVLPQQAWLYLKQNGMLCVLVFTHIHILWIQKKIEVHCFQLQQKVILLNSTVERRIIVALFVLSCCLPIFCM